jgi:DNA-directed RNA polymerase specialized sigma24 family protein
VIPNDAPRDLAQAYERYMTPLLSAIDALGRKGWDVVPEDGLELVHEFLAESFDTLLDNFRPLRGSFGPYLYTAFLKFVCDRMELTVQSKEMFVPLDQVDEPAVRATDFPEDDDEAADAAPSQDEVMLAGIKKLPRRFRRILEVRLSGCASERELARHLHLSRYGVRKRLAEAIGRMAIATDHDETICPDLRPLAIRLWRDNIPLAQAAEDMNLSKPEAWARYRELMSSLTAAAVSTLEDVPSAQRKEAIHG